MLETSPQRTCRTCGGRFHDAPDLPRGHWSRFCSETCRVRAKVAAGNRAIMRQYHQRAHRVTA